MQENRIKRLIKKWFEPLPNHGEEHREMWPSRAAFMLAAIGSSIGLGNVWRFPALAYKFGGGAFFVPYLLALFVVGIPLLALELSLGQLYRSGDVISFSSISPRLRGLGLSSIYGAFIVNTYYTVLLSWIVVYFFRSFSSTLPWTVMEPMTYFNEQVLRKPLEPTESPQYIIGSVFGAQIFTWLVVYFCIWKGVQLTGKVVYFTVLLPVLFLVILLIRGVTLPGAIDGIRMYVGQFDASALANPLIWSEAVAQIFFSIGIAFGTMTAYASYNNKYQNTAVDAFIIAISNSLYEIFCGFVVFSVVGYLKHMTNKEDVAIGGFGLAFATYPVAFSTLPGGQFWCVFFFLTLFILGIDSAFSLLEGVVTVFKDARAFHKYARESMVAVFCIAGFLIGVLFCTEAGIYAVDAVDYFINNIAIVFVGMMECAAAGYFYKYDTVVEKIGPVSFWIFVSTQACGFVFGIALSTMNLYLGIIVAGVIILFGAITAVAVTRKSELTMKARVWYLFLGPVELLRDDINSNFQTGKKTRLPILWSISIKYICLPVLFIMFCVPFRQMAVGNPNVPTTFRWVGILIACVALLMVVSGLIYPPLYRWLMPPKMGNDDKPKDAAEIVELIEMDLSADTLVDEINVEQK